MSSIYRAKAEEYEGLAATVESPFREALLVLLQNGALWPRKAEIEHNSHHAFQSA